MEKAFISDGAPERTFRTLFISDVHLGSKAAKAVFLIDLCNLWL